MQGWSRFLKPAAKAVTPYVPKDPTKELQKSEIINALGARYGFSSYLEISAPTTGRQHRLIDRSQYVRCERLVYSLQADTPIEGDITYSTAENTSSAIIEALSAANPYDLVFADPYHSYENSFEDIIGAFSLVRPGGALVVHDCNPTDPAIVSSTFTDGAWCGVTYWAYVDFVLGRSGISYYTVDTDHGCGVVFKRPSSTADTSATADTSRLEFMWACASRTDQSRYAFFDQHRQRLLNLISVQEFCNAIGA